MTHQEEENVIRYCTLSVIRSSLVKKLRLSFETKANKQVLNMGNASVVIHHGSLTRDRLTYFIKRLNEKQALSQVQELLNIVNPYVHSPDPSVTVLNPFVCRSKESIASDDDDDEEDYGERQAATPNERKATRLPSVRKTFFGTTPKCGFKIRTTQWKVLKAKRCKERTSRGDHPLSVRFDPRASNALIAQAT